MNTVGAGDSTTAACLSNALQQSRYKLVSAKNPWLMSIR